MDNYDVLESCVRVTLGRVCWTHKIHEKQAEIEASRYKRLETYKIIAASLTSAGLVAVLIKDTESIKILTALCSFISVSIAAYFKSFDLQTIVGKHKETAHEVLVIRDKLTLLILQIHMREEPLDTLFRKYEELENQLHSVYSAAPATTHKAVDLAGKALNVTKDNTITNMEINQQLPVALRKDD